MTRSAVAKVNLGVIDRKEGHEGQKNPSLLSDWVLNKGQVRKGGGHRCLPP